jgi:cyanate permease
MPAPEPKDLKWENINVSFFARFRNTLLVVYATVSLIAFCFGCIYGLKVFQNSLFDKYLDIKKASEMKRESFGILDSDEIISKNNRNKRIANLVSWLIGVFISIINKILSTAITWLTNKEKNQTMTSHSMSMSIKLMLVKSINSTLIPFALNSNPSDWYKNNELISDAFSILVTMTIFDVFAKIIDL